MSDFLDSMQGCLSAIKAERNASLSEKVTIAEPLSFKYDEELSFDDHIIYSISLEELKIHFDDEAFLNDLKGSQMCKIVFLNNNLQLFADISKDSEKFLLHLGYEMGDEFSNVDLYPSPNLIYEDIVKSTLKWIGESDETMCLDLQRLEQNFKRIKEDLKLAETDNSVLNIESLKDNQYFLNYIWGPPGTGKTYNTAKLLNELLDEGKNCLVLSISNQAVDNILLEFLKHDTSITKKPVRFGNLLSKNYGKLKDYSGEGAFENIQLSKLVFKRDALKDNLKVYKTNEKRQEAIEEIQTLNKEIKDLVKKLIVDEKRSLFTTITQAFVSDLFSQVHFDYLIIEEASMVSEVVFRNLLHLVSEKVICVGDPKQLPPVVLTQDGEYKKVLNKTPFDIFGLRRANKIQSNCIFLNKSNRMPSEITEALSDEFYDGKLHGDVPSTGDYFNLINLNSLSSIQESGVGVHCTEAAKKLVDLVLEKGWKPKEVGIITPFRKQKSNILREFRDRGKKEFLSRVFTVHSSQGDGFDYVLFDTAHYGTEIVPHNFLIHEEYSDNISDKLINVALSRVKKELYVFTCKDFLRKYRGQVKALCNIIDELEN